MAIDFEGDDGDDGDDDDDEDDEDDEDGDLSSSELGECVPLGLTPYVSTSPSRPFGCPL